jgi:hypothetical protein
MLMTTTIKPAVQAKFSKSKEKSQSSKKSSVEKDRHNSSLLINFERGTFGGNQ